MRTPFSPCGKGVGSAPRRQGKTGGSEKTTLFEARLEFCSRKAVRTGVGPAHATELCRPQGDATSVGRPAGWIEARNAVDATVEYGGLDGRMQWLRWPNAVAAMAECSGCDRRMQWMRSPNPSLPPENPPDATAACGGCDGPIQGCNRRIHRMRPSNRGLQPNHSPGATVPSTRFRPPARASVTPKKMGHPQKVSFSRTLLVYRGVSPPRSHRPAGLRRSSARPRRCRLFSAQSDLSLWRAHRRSLVDLPGRRFPRTNEQGVIR